MRYQDQALLRRETARYLGVCAPDESTLALIDQALSLLLDAASPRHLVQEFPLAVPAQDTLEAAGIRFESHSLSRALSGCTHVLFFAATLGAQCDRLLLSHQHLHIALAAVLHACGAALIEAYCDDVCASLTQEYRARSLYLRPRFSPGYGDLSLAVQRPLLAALRAPERLGLTLTEAFLMAPAKSVSALIGLSPVRCEHEMPCTRCTKLDCPYRRTKLED